MSDQIQWLSAKGLDRKQAVEQAASQLLYSYRRCWDGMLPVDLACLAETLNAEIRPVKKLRSGARLLPTSGGFLVLVSDDLPVGKYRTSIAHELAHTLFYSRAKSIPQRLLPTGRTEEYFCFDVARRLLAPHWLLDEVGLRSQRDSGLIFSTLHKQFCLSKSIAARVMLEDYSLLHGIAGLWVQHEGKWVLKRGYSYSSPLLNNSSRKRLQFAALRWLEQKSQIGTDRRVIGTISSNKQSAFVIVDIPQYDNCGWFMPATNKEDTTLSHLQLEFDFN